MPRTACLMATSACGQRELRSVARLMVASVVVDAHMLNVSDGFFMVCFVSKFVCNIVC